MIDLFLKNIRERASRVPDKIVITVSDEPRGMSCMAIQLSKLINEKGD